MSRDDLDRHMQKTFATCLAILAVWLDGRKEVSANP